MKYEKLIANTSNNHFAEILIVSFYLVLLITSKESKCNKNQRKIWNLREFIFIYILKAMKSLPSNKASPVDNIPLKILKNSVRIYSEKTY